MAAPALPQYTQNAPSRSEPTTFDEDADYFASFISTMYAPYNAFGVYFDALADTTEGYRDEAALSASNAFTSAENAASTSGYMGLWSAQTGAASKPYSVGHEGGVWALNVDLADVTLSEPSNGNSDWQFISGNRWQSLTASTTLNANAQYYIDATVSAVDLTQPSFLMNDFIVIKVSKGSTETVRLLNPSNTIIFENGELLSGDNLVINAGSTVHLVAKTTNILEWVGD